ncbi:DUF1214 domain-containing protein [Caballeronia sp. BCC1704]|uniref:DUF1214 domain-containing protein n=1 Tax=Caballeronia sp. BCC1704 TaxID=2676300 RepID=UPI0015890DD6|nr:DUF1214 domain-containing protein [Caballeronia sp. BCC1704]
MKSIRASVIVIAATALAFALQAQDATAQNSATDGTHSAQAPSAGPLSDEQISQAYIYLLGRLFVTRQEQLDFQEGFHWNQLNHRKPGAVDWPNPNLDVAYSEAWVAVDDSSCTVVTVPQVKGRYFTVQVLSGWGETLANINERVFPRKPYGDFALCLNGSKVPTPTGATRIDLPVKYSRILTRVALGSDVEGAVALQHQFRLTTTGSPALPSIPKTPLFGLEDFPGVEAFDAAAVALDSDPDRNAGLEGMSALVRQVANAARDPSQRKRIDHVVRTKALAEIAEAGEIIGHGTAQSGWARPGVVGEYGTDYLTRTLVNYRGIWANIKPEVLYYRGAKDSTGAELNGDNVYTLTFPKDALPSRFANYFWSVIAVDSARFRVLPNALNKYLINEASGLTYADDGSLTLYFAAEKPANAPQGNWLPTPRGSKYRLTFRYYGPIDAVANGTYFPPALKRVP